MLSHQNVEIDAKFPSEFCRRRLRVGRETNRPTPWFGPVAGRSRLSGCRWAGPEAGGRRSEKKAGMQKESSEIDTSGFEGVAYFLR